MSLESATFINQLNQLNPEGPVDLVSTADDHLRLIKKTLLNTFPNVVGPIDASNQDLSSLKIVTASGTANAIQLTPDPAWPTIVDGKGIQFKATATSDPAQDVTVTIGINSPVALVTSDGARAQITNGGIYTIRYNGTNFVLLNQSTKNTISDSFTFQPQTLNQAVDINTVSKFNFNVNGTLRAAVDSTETNVKNRIKVDSTADLTIDTSIATASYQSSIVLNDNGVLFKNSTNDRAWIWTNASDEEIFKISNAQVDISKPLNIDGASITISSGTTLKINGTAQFTNFEYTGTLTGSTGVVNIGSGQFYKAADGSIGIGTTLPSTKFTVSGNANITGTLTTPTRPEFTNDTTVATTEFVTRIAKSGPYNRQIVKANQVQGGILLINNKIYVSGALSQLFYNSITGGYTTEYQELAFPISAYGKTISKVKAYGLNIYALMTDGTLWAIGKNDSGQLGVGDTVDRSIFTQITFFPANGLTVEDFWVPQWVASNNTTRGYCFARASNGNLYSWGYNASGQLGIGSTTQQTSPQLVTGMSGVIKLSASDTANGHVLAVRASEPKRVYAWGDGGYGQLGQGNTNNQTSPVVWTTQSRDVFEVIAAANNVFTTAWTGVVGNSYVVFGSTPGSQELRVCGYNGYGQLGLGNTTQQTSPQLVTGINDIAKLRVSEGYYGSAYVLKSTGELLSCGRNANGQLGNGGTTNRNVFASAWDNWSSYPVIDFEVGSAAGFTQVAAIVQVAPSINFLVTAGYNTPGTLATGETSVTANNNFKWTTLPMNTSVDKVVIYTASGNSDDSMMVVKMTDNRLYTSGINVNYQLSAGLTSTAAVVNKLVPVKMRD